MCYLDVHGLSGNSISLLIAATLASTVAAEPLVVRSMHVSGHSYIGVKFPSPRLSGSMEWNGGMELQI